MSDSRFSSCAAQSHLANYFHLERDKLFEALRGTPDIFGPMLKAAYARQIEMADVVGFAVRAGNKDSCSLFLTEVEKMASFIELLMEYQEQSGGSSIS